MGHSSFKEGSLPSLTSVLAVLQEPLVILNRDGGFMKGNRRAIELLGYHPEELQKMLFFDLVSGDDLTLVHGEFQKMAQGQEVSFRIGLISHLGERICVEFAGALHEQFFIITLRDLRERIRYEEELEKTKRAFTEKIRERDQYSRDLQALNSLLREKSREIEKMREEAVRLSYTDDLTGIYNYRFFIEQLTLEVERQKRYPKPLSLLMIDIDYFKHYNDANGHIAGDKVLKAITILIQRGVRQTDIVARYGGEEFSAILFNAGREGGKEIAERVRRIVAETRFPNEGAQPNGDLTVSIGVATFTPPVLTLTDLIREADNALYRAKKAGRNRVEG